MEFVSIRLLTMRNTCLFTLLTLVSTISYAQENITCPDVIEIQKAGVDIIEWFVPHQWTIARKNYAYGTKQQWDFQLFDIFIAENENDARVKAVRALTTLRFVDLPRVPTPPDNRYLCSYTIDLGSGMAIALTPPYIF